MKRCLVVASAVLFVAALAGCGERASRSGEAASPGAIGGSSITPPVSTSSPLEANRTMTANLSGTPTKFAPPAGTTVPNVQEAMFGAGCFWGVEATFANTPGVLTTAVGFAGGTVDKPTYRQVCGDTTGHAEVVHLTFDPVKVTYQQLLKVFFENHDPTQVNRQGPDYGDQYRTVIFAYGEEQKNQAEAAKKALGESGKFKRPIATVVEAAKPFWRAEEYHQRYLEKQGLDSCHVPTK